MKSKSSWKPFFLVLITAPALVSFSNGPARAGDKQDGSAPYRRIVTIEGITEYRLGSNGVRFLLFPDPSASTVTVNMTVFVGSRHEGYGETGMAHLLEHMLFKGSKRFPFIDKALIAHGAGKSANATTWTDRTNYFETMPGTDENLEFGLNLESDRLINSFIRREDLAKEMTVVRNEFEQGENSPDTILNQRMMAVAFEWHNYGKSTIGNRSDIERVPVERLHEFYKKYYQPDNIMVIVAGKFDDAKAKAYMVKYFGPLKRPERVLPKTYTEEPAQDGERTVTLRRVGKVAVTGLMYHIPAAGHDEHAAVEILARILGDTPSGRLYKALVETKKASQVGSDASAWHDPGILELTAHVADKTTNEEVRDIMLDVLENFAKKPATKEETDRAVQQYLSERDRALTKSKAIAMELSEWAAAGDWRLLFIHRDQVAKVKPDDVNKVAAKYLRQSNRTVGMFIPTTEVARTPVPPTPDIEALVKDYKGGKSLAQGEAFDPTPENIEKRVRRLTLPNGVKVALLNKKTRGEAVLGSMELHFGNEKSLRGNTDAAEFIGSLIMRGSKKRDYQEIQDALDKLKSTLTASSSAGSLSLSWQSKREQLPAVLDLLREVLREPAFPEKEFEILRRSEKQRLEKALTDPHSLAYNALARKLNPYPKDHVLYTPTIQESLERLDKVTVADVRRVYEEQIGGDQGEIVLVGDFAADKTVKQLEEALAGWKAKVPYERIARTANAKVAAAKENILTPDKEGATYAAGMTFPYKDTAADYAALRVGNYILGASYTSRLWLRLREKEGLCYGVGSRLNVDPQDAYTSFNTFAICNPENIDKVDKSMAEEVTKIVREGISGSELDSAKKGYLEDLKVERSSDSSLAGMLRSGLYLNRTMKYYAALEKNISDLQVEDVNRALSAHLNPKRLVIIRAGDFKSSGSDKK
jgi:zinc protease